MSKDTPAKPPFRRLVLMPWRWGRWVRWLVCGLLLVGPPIYFLSAVPVTRVLRHLQQYRIAAWANSAYRPVWMLSGRLPAAASVIKAQWRLMDEVLGPEPTVISY